jgi:hypothetical protein
MLRTTGAFEVFIKGELVHSRLISGAAPLVEVGPVAINQLPLP